MLSVAIEQSPVSIIICEVDGSVEYVNRHFEKTSGYKASEILGLNYSILQSEQTPANTYHDMWETVEKGEDWQGQICNKQRNGEIYWEQMSLTPIRDSHGNIFRYLAVKEDITERKQREKLVAEAQEKEIQSKKMAAIGLLASGVAHDLNNILSGVISYPEILLLNNELDDKVRSALVSIKRSGEQAAGIVADLLTMARGATIVKEPLDFSEIVNEFSESTELAGLRAAHPEIVFELKLEKKLSLVDASHVHIFKILLNLVTNAAEAFSAEIKAKRITMRCQNHRLNSLLESEYAIIPAGEYVVLTVLDNGQGISLVDKERIFEPFYSKKKMGKSGSGLGLAVVWNVVQEHDAFIELQSEYGKTQFMLYFPVTHKIANQKVNKTSLEQFYGNRERVLIVDDVELQREIAGMLLSELRYDCVAVESGEKAVEYLRSHTVDLVLLDMIMEPGINGLETYRRMLKINPSQKAIIVSGYSESKDVVITQELGASICLGKPYTMEILGKAVKSVLA